jgi:hypothetical protein
MYDNSRGFIYVLDILIIQATGEREREIEREKYKKKKRKIE